MPARTPTCPRIMLPRIIIIGRPNVGKSTLFNRLVGKKLALVDDQPGVTRDRRAGDAEIAGLRFTVFDTAGWEDQDADSLPGRMRKQTELSLVDADAALMVIDARAGVTTLDEEIALWLRAQKVPVVMVCNKAEGKAAEAGIYESYALGFGDPVPVSAEHGEGIADLFGALWPIIGDSEARIEAEEAEAAETRAAQMQDARDAGRGGGQGIRRTDLRRDGGADEARHRGPPQCGQEHADQTDCWARNAC